MIRTQIQLSDEQARRVKAMARREDVSMAEILRRGLDRLIAEEEPTRADRWAEADAMVGAFVDAARARDVAARHDAYLDEAYR
ncbi:MAG TPA: ribbon-helix-helix protein, CopG family [Longimicrobiales bacterium]|nr:ribbon-helix-helix protein, CopG family [Longimicrobiales bacterium]